MTDIVAVAFGSYVTNDSASIAKAMQAGLKPRLISRVQAECLAKIFNLDTCKKLATAPALLPPEELAALQATVDLAASNSPVTNTTIARTRKPRTARAKSAAKAAPRHS